MLTIHSNIKSNFTPRLILLTLLLFCLVYLQPTSATNLKVTGVNWKTNWSHPGAVTTLSGKTIKTKYPNTGNIPKKYHVFINVRTNAGNTILPIHIIPITHKAMFHCPSITPTDIRPNYQSYCQIKNSKALKLTKQTRIKFKINSGGGGTKYLYWKIIPPNVQETSGTSQPSSQKKYYTIKGMKLVDFARAASQKGYTIKVNHISGNSFNIAPTIVPKSHGLRFHFGNVKHVPLGTPPSLALNETEYGDSGPGVVRVKVFGGKKTLNTGWTLESVKYQKISGETCSRKNRIQSFGSNMLFHQFDVEVQFFHLAPSVIKTCSMMYLKEIRLKGPRNTDPINALRD